MKTFRSSAASFSLIEVTIALGVAAISLIGIFTLLPVGLQTNSNATEQTASNDMLAAVIADLRATPKTSSTSNQFGISLPAAPNTAAVSSLYFDSYGRAVAPGAARYRLTITFPANPGGLRKATLVDLKMTWPAAVDPNRATPIGSAEAFTALDRN